MIYDDMLEIDTQVDILIEKLKSLPKGTRIMSYDSLFYEQDDEIVYINSKCEREVK